LALLGAYSPIARYLFGSGFIYPRGCVKSMKTRYRLMHRGVRGGIFYCVDTFGRDRLHAYKLQGSWDLDMAASEN
jgi:hypothetical protein